MAPSHVVHVKRLPSETGTQYEYHKMLDRETRKEEGDEQSDDGEADADAKFKASKGVADVDNLREHAASRQHILNIQVIFCAVP